MVERKRMWEVTTWDKKFSGVDKLMQPKVLKYHYYLANELAEMERPNGNIRILYTTDKEAYVDSEDVEGNIAEGEVVTIPWGGNVNIQYYKGKFVTADNRIATSNNIDYLNNKYLYYWMLSQKEEIGKFYRGAGIKHPSMLSVLTMLVPIPSLSEQQRIVGILDTFTSAIDNLKDQIAQRRKQYEYYRDQLYYASKADLLEASRNGKAIVKSLDELGTFTRGRRFVRTDIVPEGVPCIHYGDMYTYYGVSAEETPTHLTKELSSKLRFAKNGDVVIVAAGENDLDIGVGVAWLGKEPVVVHDACFIYEHKMNPKYLSHFMRSRNYHQQIRMGVVDGKICSISAKELGRALIAVPSLQEQQRIVSILDTFEASIQNLEAQLKQREKQYEYYRNKLLTFE